MTSQPDMTTHSLECWRWHPSCALAHQTSVKLHGRHLERGVEFSVRGVRGRFRFVEMTTHLPTDSTWITGYGGDTNPQGRRQFRSFSPEDIRTVHSKNKMR